MTTNKQKYLDACLILHGMCMDWLHENGLVIAAYMEIERAAKYRKGCDTIDKSFTDDDEYMIENPDDELRTYVSHLLCVPVKLGDEWLKIDRSFRSNLSFMLEVLETRSFNDGLLEFFDEAVSTSYDVSKVDEMHEAAWIDARDSADRERGYLQTPCPLYWITPAYKLTPEMVKAADDLDKYASSYWNNFVNDILNIK